jgi:putative Mn2+ efflux pump MntP
VPPLIIDAFMLLQLSLVGLALSMDALAVTIANQVAYPQTLLSRRIMMPVVFALFQGLMPLAGFFLALLVGTALRDAIGALAMLDNSVPYIGPVIAKAASWLVKSSTGIVTFVILGVIGFKMILDGARALRRARRGMQTVSRGSIGIFTLLMQAVATSLDAFAVGIGYAASNMNIFVGAFVIALSTFVTCSIALLLARRFGRLLGDKAEIAGGIVLVVIAVKSLFF